VRGRAEQQEHRLRLRRHRQGHLIQHASLFMRTPRFAVWLLGVLCMSQALAWGNHSFPTYRALEKLHEVADAAPVVAEPLDAFLRTEEKTIEALLASQEAWAVANLEKYPPRPASLAFAASANADASDEARKRAFLMALRVAPNSKFALYLQTDPWNPTPGQTIGVDALSPLAAPINSYQRLIALRPGDTVSALAVVASATDEPDFGLDVFLWNDSPSEWGQYYEWGPIPFGDPSSAAASQEPFHMAFLHESHTLYWAMPELHRTFLGLRHYQFSTLAALAFRTGHAYWGWRFSGLALYYLQDLVEPYRARLSPNDATVKLLGAQTLASLGFGSMKNDYQMLRANRIRVIEKYQSELMDSMAQGKTESNLSRVLRNGEKDKSYPDWNDRYLRDVVSPQAIQFSARLAAALITAMPPAYVSDPLYDFGANASGINLLAELSKRDPTDRARLDNILTELLGNFASHSRNALRGILRASNPM
jgi:hypothetical protein